MGQKPPEQRAPESPAQRDSSLATATARAGEDARLPGRLIRLVAIAIDFALPVIVVGVLAFAGTLATGFPILTTPWGLLAFVVFIVIGAGALSATAAWLSDGQSVGKAVCGLEVRHTGTRTWDGQPSTLAWAFARATIGYLVVDCFGIGGVGALTGRYRRAAHDLVFASYVVHVDSATVGHAGTVAERLNLRIKEFERRRKAGLDRYTEKYGHVAGLVKWVNKLVTGMASIFAAAGVWLFGSTAAGSAAAASTTGTVLVATGGVVATGSVVFLGVIGGGAAVDFPRAVEHGVLGVEVTSVVVTDVDPRDPEAGANERAFVGVDLSVSNPLRDQSFELPASLFTLESEQQPDESGFLIDDEGALALGPTDDVSSTVWFEYDANPELAELTLIFEEGRGEHPTRLPLTGEIPPASIEVPMDPTSGGGDAAHGVTLEVQTDEPPYLTLNGELSPAGEILPSGCTTGSLGRVERDHFLVVVPAVVSGNRPDTSSLPSLSFNAVNYGVPLQASADGSSVPVCENFGDLDTRREGAFAVVVPQGTTTVDVWFGCPCGGLLTGSVVENELFRVSIPTEAAADLF